MLLRSHSLYDAMYYSRYIGTKLKLWKDKDSLCLDDIIARIGIPIDQAK